jgi:hypothetical protein
MIVICKKSTKRLIKNHRYEVDALWNSGNNQKWLDGKLSIKGIGRFNVNNFTDTDGKNIPKIDISPRSTQTVSRLKFEDLKVGDLLICDSDSFTLFAKGCMYKVLDLNSISTERKKWDGTTYIHTENKIKFEGINRWLKFSPWKFRTLTPEEQREISLNSILLGEKPDIVTSKEIRKIDLVPNKNLALMKVISQSILDINRHHLSILDWSIEKTGSSLKVKDSDFKDLMDMKLSDILKLIENK